MPVPDLPQALATSAVDGALIPWEIIPALKLQDVTQYQIEGPEKSRFGTTTFQISMNKARWESLPDDIKEVFDTASDEDWLRNGRPRSGAPPTITASRSRIDAGNEHVTLTEEEMATFDEALAPVVDEWVAAHTDFDAQALVDAARAAIGDTSALERWLGIRRRGRAVPFAAGGRGACSARSRWWALVGGLLARRARRHDGGERGIEPAARPTLSRRLRAGQARHRGR